MRQGIVGGLLVIGGVVGGVILSPFRSQVLGWGKALVLSALSAILSAGSYGWTLWAHGGADTFLWLFLVVLWAVILIWMVVFMAMAVNFVVKAGTILILAQKRSSRIDFYEIILNLCYSLSSLLFCAFFWYLASLVDAGVGALTTHSSLLEGNPYDSLFFWGMKGYLYVYPVSMVVAGLYILQDSCRKWGQSMSRG